MRKHPERLTRAVSGKAEPVRPPGGGLVGRAVRRCADVPRAPGARRRRARPAPRAGRRGARPRLRRRRLRRASAPARAALPRRRLARQRWSPPRSSASPAGRRSRSATSTTTPRLRPSPRRPSSARSTTRATAVRSSAMSPAYTTRKLVFDLNPRQYPLEEVVADLRTAGLTDVDAAPVLRPPDPRIAGAGGERSSGWPSAAGRSARFALRYRFTYVVAASRARLTLEADLRAEVAGVARPHRVELLRDEGRTDLDLDPPRSGRRSEVEALVGAVLQRVRRARPSRGRAPAGGRLRSSTARPERRRCCASGRARTTPGVRASRCERE